jgi:hypothetical protein
MAMIIWSGRGFLVAVYAFGCSLIANLLCNSIAGTAKYWEQHRWVLSVALLAAAALSWLTGKALVAAPPKAYIDKETGEEVSIGGGHHTFFFIQMYWWGPILAVIALIVLLNDLLT